MNKARVQTARGRRAAAAACAHHWVIESPAVPTSRGCYTLCGAENDFPNYAQYSPGNDVRYKIRGANGNGQPVERPANGAASFAKEPVAAGRHRHPETRARVRVRARKLG